MSKRHQNVQSVSETPVTETVTPETAEVEIVPEPEPETAPEASITFVFARTTPNGTSTFEVPGLRGSLFVTKSMWANGPLPQSFTLPAKYFAAPKVVVVKASKDPEVATKKAAEAIARAEKLTERANKLVAQAGRLVPKAPVEPAFDPFAGIETPEVAPVEEVASV